MSERESLGAEPFCAECGHPKDRHWSFSGGPGSCSATVDIRHPATGGDGLKMCPCKGYTLPGRADDTNGVVWDVPKDGGGYFSEAVCWRGDCQWRWTSDKREEVEREMERHLREVHGA